MVISVFTLQHQTPSIVVDSTAPVHQRVTYCQHGALKVLRYVHDGTGHLRTKGSARVGRNLVCSQIFNEWIQKKKKSHCCLRLIDFVITNALCRQGQIWCLTKQETRLNWNMRLTLLDLHSLKCLMSVTHCEVSSCATFYRQGPQEIRNVSSDKLAVCRLYFILSCKCTRCFYFNFFYVARPDLCYALEVMKRFKREQNKLKMKQKAWP